MFVVKSYFPKRQLNWTDIVERVTLRLTKLHPVIFRCNLVVTHVDVLSANLFWIEDFWAQEPHDWKNGLLYVVGEVDVFVLNPGVNRNILHIIIYNFDGGTIIFANFERVIITLFNLYNHLFGYHWWFISLNQEILMHWTDERKPSPRLKVCLILFTAFFDAFLEAEVSNIALFYFKVNELMRHRVVPICILLKILYFDHSWHASIVIRINRVQKYRGWIIIAFG